MPALRAISERLSAACSRVNARMTASPFASPPIASRRTGVALRRAMRPPVYFDIRKAGRGRLDAPSSAGPLSFRIATKYSLCEECIEGVLLKIGRQDEHSSGISTSNAETIVVRGRNLAQELMGKVSFTELMWLLVTGSMPS